MKYKTKFKKYKWLYVAFNQLSGTFYITADYYHSKKDAKSYYRKNYGDDFIILNKIKHSRRIK